MIGIDRTITLRKDATASQSYLRARHLGLVPSLRAAARQFERATGVFARVVVVGDVPVLGQAIADALRYAACESLLSLERRGRATGVVMKLRATPAFVQLTIRDDGVGLYQRQVADGFPTPHMGLRAIARAIEDVGGTFGVASVQPRGLLITATVPR